MHEHIEIPHFPNCTNHVPLPSTSEKDFPPVFQVVSIEEDGLDEEELTLSFNSYVDELSCIINKLLSHDDELSPNPVEMSLESPTQGPVHSSTEIYETIAPEDVKEVMTYSDTYFEKSPLPCLSNPILPNVSGKKIFPIVLQIPMVEKQPQFAMVDGWELSLTQLVAMNFPFDGGGGQDVDSFRVPKFQPPRLRFLKNQLLMEPTDVILRKSLSKAIRIEDHKLLLYD